MTKFRLPSKVTYSIALVSIATVLLLVGYEAWEVRTHNMAAAIRGPYGAVTVSEFDWWSTPGDNANAARLEHDARVAKVLRWAMKAHLIPRGLHVVTGHCGLLHGNSQSSEDRREIDFCSNIQSTSNWHEAGDTRIDDDANVFILLHELAHIVIGQTNAPVVGQEEDDADEFATIAAANLGFSSTAEAGAALFASWGPKSSYSDPHSSGERRAAYVRCLLYGWKANRYSNFVTAAGKDANDNWKRTCIKTYNSRALAWDTILRTHLFTYQRQLAFGSAVKR